MRIAVYTAIFGKYDDYREPPVGDFEAFVFSDEAVPTRRAQLRQMSLPVPGDPRRSARLLKCLPHLFLPEFDVTLWLDGRFALKERNLTALADKYLKVSPWITFAHPDRRCIYAEGAVIIQGLIDDPIRVSRQMAAYKALQYPSNNGLAATGAILRHSLFTLVKTLGLALFNQT